MAVKIRKEVVDNMLIKSNKTQAWLADQVSTTASHMNNMLAGRVNLSAPTREKIMEVLNVPLECWDDLFYTDEEQDVSETSQPMPV